MKKILILFLLCVIFETQAQSSEEKMHENGTKLVQLLRKYAIEDNFYYDERSENIEWGKKEDRLHKNVIEFSNTTIKLYELREHVNLEVAYYIQGSRYEKEILSDRLRLVDYSMYSGRIKLSKDIITDKKVEELKRLFNACVSHYNQDRAFKKIMETFTGKEL